MVRFMWEGINHGEKFIQVAKDEFTSQRGDKHEETLMHKIFIKNIIAFEQS